MLGVIIAVPDAGVLGTASSPCVAKVTVGAEVYPTPGFVIMTPVTTPFNTASADIVDDCLIPSPTTLTVG